MHHKYFSILPMRSIVVTELYTVHYFENFKNYYFSGERHDFWEILYVDRGEIIVETDRFERPIRMERGDLLLHRPNEFHSFYANNIVPHNLFVVSFASGSPAMEHFQEHPFFHTRSPMRAKISRLLEESRSCFSSPLADPNVPKLKRDHSAPFGAEQVVVNTLELLLISLYRHEDVRSEAEAAEHAQVKLADDYVQRAIVYMKANLTNRITLEDICVNTAISSSQMQRMFRQKTGKSAMRYFSELRIEEAKFLMRSRNMTFTEIAEFLCYSSIHHFSKQFHTMVGMSPSDYISSVQTMTEGV